MSTLELTRVEPAGFAARRDAIRALDAAARGADGHDALGDSVWRDLDDPGADSVGFLVADRAYVHVARAQTAGNDGAARDEPHWTAGLVRLASARDLATTVMLLDAAAAHVAVRGGGRLDCWVFGTTPADDAPFGAAGFAQDRDLYEMRVGLPIAAQPKWPAGIRVRPFEPGRDDAGWLVVNNRAFAGHPDQGGWTASTLEHRMAEPWFDPSLFLLGVDAEGIAGFNWLQRHPARDPDPVLGEIYVIGVDPRAQGSGLGRALAIAGLHAVNARGIGTGQLFCAADNTGALALYRSLGFVVHRTDRAYSREIAAA